jgi:hypothetical protein
MLELDVAASLVHLAPALQFKPADNFRTLQVCNYKHNNFNGLSTSVLGWHPADD